MRTPWNSWRAYAEGWEVLLSFPTFERIERIDAGNQQSPSNYPIVRRRSASYWPFLLVCKMELTQILAPQIQSLFHLLDLFPLQGKRVSKRFIVIPVEEG
jgi:hypothetical protein